MADFERTTTVGVGADAAFTFLADPRRLAVYSPAVAHVETTVVDGDEPLEGDSPADAAARAWPGTGGVRFFADTSSRQIEWAVPAAAYEGTIVVTGRAGDTSEVMIRLRAADETGAPEIERALDQTVANLRRLLVRRRPASPAGSAADDFRGAARSDQ